jgi:hypothetical protein
MGHHPDKHFVLYYPIFIVFTMLYLLCKTILTFQCLVYKFITILTAIYIKHCSTVKRVLFITGLLRNLDSSRLTKVKFTLKHAVKAQGYSSNLSQPQC